MRRAPEAPAVGAVHIEDFDESRLAKLGRHVLELEVCLGTGGPTGELGQAACRLVESFLSGEKATPT